MCWVLGDLIRGIQMYSLAWTVVPSVDWLVHRSGLHVDEISDSRKEVRGTQ